MSLDRAPSVPLKDVEWRLDSEPKDGDRGMRARFVPHINARTAAALMDEWVGPCGWSQSDAVITIAGKEAVQCTVSVWDGTQWVSKQDVGVASNTEPQKGAVSDAFKRVVTVKWGAGRNVYELPTLWAPCKAVTGQNGKLKGYATDATLPDLLRQLKQKGFDADGCRLEDGAIQQDAEGAGSLGKSGLSNEKHPAASSATSPSGSESPQDAANGPESSSPSVTSGQPSKAQIAKLKARGLAINDITRVNEKRLAWQLPFLNECDAKQLELYGEMLREIEVELEAPFAEATT